MVSLFTIIGMVGVAFAIGGYGATQLRIINSDMWQFPASNLICCTLVMVSLIDRWNLPSFILQMAYAVISLIGLLKCWRSVAQSPHHPEAV